MNLYDFHYAMSLLNTMFGITLQEDMFEETALIGWGLIKNKRTRLYRYTTRATDCEEGVKLPCNCYEVEAVTTGFEECNYTTNDTPNGDLHSAFVESYIEHRKMFRHPMYIPGKYIRYELIGDTLYFDRPYGDINILYKGELVDDNGLPKINEKEALALATYCAYVVKYREGLETNNFNLIKLAQDLEDKWKRRCNQARVQYMSQNEFDQILDAKTSWARKQHNRSLKTYQ